MIPRVPQRDGARVTVATVAGRVAGQDVRASFLALLVVVLVVVDGSGRIREHVEERVRRQHVAALRRPSVVRAVRVLVPELGVLTDELRVETLTTEGEVTVGDAL